MVVIEPAEATDVPEIRQILSQTWTDTYGHFLSRSTIQTVTTVWHAPELLAAQVKNPDILFRLAKDETGAIVGLITAHQNDQGRIMINRLYVLPQFQRQGVGCKLLNEII